jgi:hypothetical protein
MAGRRGRKGERKDKAPTSLLGGGLLHDLLGGLLGLFGREGGREGGRVRREEEEEGGTHTTSEGGMEERKLTLVTFLAASLSL